MCSFPLKAWVSMLEIWLPFRLKSMLVEFNVDSFVKAYAGIAVN